MNRTKRDGKERTIALGLLMRLVQSKTVLANKDQLLIRFSLSDCL
jgi:hypothetical protein